MRKCSATPYPSKNKYAQKIEHYTLLIHFIFLQLLSLKFLSFKLLHKFIDSSTCFSHRLLINFYRHFWILVKLSFSTQVKKKCTKNWVYISVTLYFCYSCLWIFWVSRWCTNFELVTDSSTCFSHWLLINFYRHCFGF